MRTTITLDLSAKVSKREQDEINRLMAAGMLDRGEEVRERLKRPTIQRMLKRGVVKCRKGGCDDYT